MSSSSSSSLAAKRCPSPLLISRPKTPTTPSILATIKRSQSVERRRPATTTDRSNSADLRIRQGGGTGEMTNAPVDNFDEELVCVISGRVVRALGE
ncbi:unnamed protein product [Linum trigynum]|uniref:Uncharacterized protein n=1 Tax=Linum trigynum TaxID=586398 RepID=A0AAV2GA79_9ROSI